MAIRDLPSQDILNQLLRYEPETGRLFWKERPSHMFKGEGRAQNDSAKAWNAVWAGKEAFTSIDSDGYRQGAIFYRRYLAHHVIWRLVTGALPEETDHDNGNRSDNRFGNLNDVTHAINCLNKARPTRNKSGVIGVHWHKKAGKWNAMICIPGTRKSVHIGLFETIEAAAAARKDAEAKHGFHKNHGRP